MIYRYLNEGITLDNAKRVQKLLATYDIVGLIKLADKLGIGISFGNVTWDENGPEEISSFSASAYLVPFDGVEYLDCYDEETFWQDASRNPDPTEATREALGVALDYAIRHWNDHLDEEDE